MGIGRMEKLQKLVFTGNQLRCLPMELGQLSKLKILWLDGNRLGPRLAPEAFEGLGSLEDLDVSGNGLVELPESFGKLKSLTRLVVAKNELRELSPGIGALTKLQDLDAS